VTVREKETVLDEKIIQRTEEVPDPRTGEPTIQTFEYVEKVIEREVRAISFCIIINHRTECKSAF
jgi:hypothetical protein